MAEDSVFDVESPDDGVQETTVETPQDAEVPAVEDSPVVDAGEDAAVDNDVEAPREVPVEEDSQAAQPSESEPTVEVTLAPAYAESVETEDEPVTEVTIAVAGYPDVTIGEEPVLVTPEQAAILATVPAANVSGRQQYRPVVDIAGIVVDTEPVLEGESPYARREDTPVESLEAVLAAQAEPVEDSE
jgi:hypothetical protein